MVETKADVSESKLSERFAETLDRCFQVGPRWDSRAEKFVMLCHHELDLILSSLRAAEVGADAVKAAVEAERESGPRPQGEYADLAKKIVRLLPITPSVGDCEEPWRIIARELSAAAAIRARSSAPPVPAPIDEAAERVKFEEWARPYGYQKDRNEHGAYVYWIMRDTWSAWLARARLGRE